MKTYNVFFSLAMATVLLASCHSGKPLVSRHSDNNTTYNVQYLFEHEGCKVYRFWDYGNYVYFTNCTGDVTAIANDSTATRVQTLGGRKIEKAR